MSRKKPIEFPQRTLDLIGAAQEMADEMAHVESENAIPGIRLGTSAFTAAGWEGSFYAPGTPTRDCLSYYATKFNSVEVDSTFYRTPAAMVVNGWYEKTPPDFMFAAKVPQVNTQEKALVNCEREFDEFVNRIDLLDDKLGLLLLQFPYFNKTALKSVGEFVGRLLFFLKRLQRSTVRYAAEIRNKS